MAQAIHELQEGGVEPDVWKAEGLDRRRDCERLVTEAGRGGRWLVGCIILGRGEDDVQVENWLVTAAAVPGVCMDLRSGARAERRPACVRY